MSRRWKENTLRNQELTAGGRIMSQPYGKLRSWNACLHLTQGVAWKVSNETWNYMKLAWFCTALQLWKSRQISQNRPQKACRKAVWCHDSFSQQRPELYVQRLEAVWLCSLGAGHHTAAFAEPELRGPADRPQCCVLMSKEVMKQEPATRQKYRVMKYLHKFGYEAIGQPQ